MTTRRPVLLVEDEPTDVFIFQRALEKTGLGLPLFVATDGQQVLDYLSGEVPYGDRAKHPLPALLVMDLKMPRLSGFEVLDWLSHHSELRNIPAVILSSSSYDEDIRKASALGAHDYYIKPSSTAELVKVVQSMADRWLRITKALAPPD